MKIELSPYVHCHLKSNSQAHLYANTRSSITPPTQLARKAGHICQHFHQHSTLINVKSNGFCSEMEKRNYTRVFYRKKKERKNQLEVNCCGNVENSMESWFMKVVT